MLALVHGLVKLSIILAVGLQEKLLGAVWYMGNLICCVWKSSYKMSGYNKYENFKICFVYVIKFKLFI